MQRLSEPALFACKQSRHYLLFASNTNILPKTIPIVGKCAGRESIYAMHLGGSERGCLRGRQIYGLLRLRVAALPCGSLPWQKSAKTALQLHW